MPKAATRYRRRKNHRLTRRRRGGAKLNCETEGFNIRMREAAFGEGYKAKVGIIHGDGERWEFEQLRDIGYNGILEWYSRMLHTEATFPTLKNIPELGVLVAFYNRYKIVAENLTGLRGVLLGPGKIWGLPTVRFIGPNSFQIFVDEKPRLAPQMKEKLIKLGTYAKDLDGLRSKDLPIEFAIDRAQCIMFYVVKHGKLPEGFVMDPRIEKRANEPIHINTVKQVFINGSPMDKVDAAIGWLDFLEKAYSELSEPEVTFGVF